MWWEDCVLREKSLCLLKNCVFEEKYVFGEKVCVWRKSAFAVKKK